VVDDRRAGDAHLLADAVEQSAVLGDVEDAKGAEIDGPWVAEFGLFRHWVETVGAGQDAQERHQVVGPSAQRPSRQEAHGIAFG